MYKIVNFGQSPTWKYFKSYPLPTYDIAIHIVSINYKCFGPAIIEALALVQEILDFWYPPDN